MKVIFAAFLILLVQAQNDTCYSDPNQPYCTNATIPDMEANMNISMACMMNSVGMYMPACTIHAICTSMSMLFIDFSSILLAIVCFVAHSISFGSIHSLICRQHELEVRA
jgi:hypothetical protein